MIINKTGAYQSEDLFMLAAPFFVLDRLFDFVKKFRYIFLRNSSYTCKQNKRKYKFADNSFVRIKISERNFMKIHLNHLSMTYPTGKQALKDINLTLESPKSHSLVGPNGAGKSTLMKLLVAGLLPTGGDIAIDDKPLTKCEKELKKKLGYLPQDFGLYDELTIWEFLDYMAALKGIRNSRPVIEEVILATGLEEKKKARIKTLSGGQRQRVGIAQALLGEPEFLIFDEPTVGLDPEERIRFRNFFSQTAQDKLVLLSTHIIEDIQSVCDRLIVIDHGRSCL